MSMVHAAAVLALVAAVVLASAAPARASCAPLSNAEQRALADVIFEGVALDGETENGTLVSPARFQVARYLKGSGPEVAQVTTAYEQSGPFGLFGSSRKSTGITPRPGERWRIHAQTTSGDVLDTSRCLGSERLSRATRPAAATSPASEVAIDQGPPWPLVAIPAVLLVALVGIAVRRLGRR